MNKNEKNKKIICFSRIRPFLNNEINLFKEYINVDEKNLSINYRDKNINFEFDKNFNHNVNNYKLFESLPNLYYFFEKGYNFTFLTYGISGSGKTHTIFGNEKEEGIIYLLVKEFFSKNIKDCDIYISFLQIYNENIEDLLKKSQNNLKVRENLEGNFYIDNLTQIKIKNINSFKKLLNYGLKIRKIRETLINEKSSRSHCILSIKSKLKFENGYLYSNINFLDLAGSEKMPSFLNEYTNQKPKINWSNRSHHIKELTNINKSLLNLCKIILEISNNKKFINFRDSILTKLLKNSLYKNCITYCLLNINPIYKYKNETFNSLKYIQLISKIKTYNKSNLHSIKNNNYIIKLEKEINFYKKILNMNNRNRGGLGEIIYELKENVKENEKIKNLKNKEIKFLKKENEKIKKELLKFKDEKSDNSTLIKKLSNNNLNNESNNNSFLPKINSNYLLKKNYVNNNSNLNKKKKINLSNLKFFSNNKSKENTYFLLNKENKKDSLKWVDYSLNKYELQLKNF